jgi:hypothetical protein
VKGPRVPWLTALVFASVHLAIVVRKLLFSRGIGEDQGWLVLWFDFPLVGLLEILPDGVGSAIYGSRAVYVTFFSVAGTLMHALFGFLLGIALQRMWSRR